MPLQSIYCASKHGVKGFTEAVRLELEHEQSGINLTLILPGSTNTRFFDHARSKMGVKPAPPPPIYEPEAVADAIVFAAEHPRRDIFIGFPAKKSELMERVSPWLTDRYMLAGGNAFKLQKTDEPDNGRDNLFEPWDDPSSVHGDFRGRPSSWYTKVFEYHPTMKAVAVARPSGRSRWSPAWAAATAGPTGGTAACWSVARDRSARPSSRSRAEAGRKGPRSRPRDPVGTGTLRHDHREHRQGLEPRHGEPHDAVLLGVRDRPVAGEQDHAVDLLGQAEPHRDLPRPGCWAGPSGS